MKKGIIIASLFVLTACGRHDLESTELVCHKTTTNDNNVIGETITTYFEDGQIREFSQQIDNDLKNSDPFLIEATYGFLKSMYQGYNEVEGITIETSKQDQKIQVQIGINYQQIDPEKLALFAVTENTYQQTLKQVKEQLEQKGYQCERKD